MKKFIPLLVLLFSIFAFTACEDSLDSSAKGTVSISIADATSRMIDSSISMEVKSYKLTISRTDGTETPIETSLKATDPSYSTELTVGEWKFSVSAYNEAGAEIGYGETTQTISSGINTVPITVQEIAGKGTFTVSVNSEVVQEKLYAEILQNDASTILIQKTELVSSTENPTVYTTTFSLDNSHYFVKLYEGNKVIASPEGFRIVKDDSVTYTKSYNSNKVSVSFSITDTISSVASDIQPSVLMESSYYLINGTSGSDYINEIRMNKSESATAILALGEWSLTVDAYNENDTKIGSGNVTTTISEAAEITIPVEELSGSGTLEVSITATEVNTGLFAEILASDGTAVITKESLSGTGSPYTGSYALDNGYYTLNLYDGETAIDTKSVRVVSGYISSYTAEYSTGAGVVKVAISDEVLPTLSASISVSDSFFKGDTLSATVTVSAEGSFSYKWYLDYEELIGQSEARLAYLIPEKLPKGAHELKVLIISEDGRVSDATASFSYLAVADSTDILTFELSENEDGKYYTVTGVTDKTVFELSIPETYNDLPVTTISGNAFWNCSDLESISMPGIRRIEDSNFANGGNGAFNNCTYLKDVDMPNLTYLGSGAFYGCTNLEYINIPDSVTYIGSFAFGDCESLKSIEIPVGIETISSYTFYGCTNLTDVYIPNSVTLIKDYAFNLCSSLASITIPEQVAAIGDRAFVGCTSLTSIEIPDRVVTIGKQAFYQCDNLETVSISETSQLTTIGIEAFRGCNSLTAIYIPNGVTSIGDSAFSLCKKLTTANLPDSLSYVSGSLFESCSSLTSINIPRRVSEMGSGVFYGCSSLTSITIPYRITNIPTNTFYGCTNLKTVIFEENSLLTQISAAAFSKCTSLTEFVIPDGVTDIANNVFEDCSNLTDIYIPDSVTSIGNTTFSRCTSLKSITIPDSVTSIDLKLFSGCSNLTDMTIPNTVTLIGSGAFEGCTSLTEITIPDSVTSIGEGAFEGCTKLTSINIPDPVTIIRNYTFNGCTSLKNIVIPEGATDIGYYAFNKCTNISDITIPASVTFMNRSFLDCENLNVINYSGTVDQWNSISRLDTSFNGGSCLSGCVVITSDEVSHTLDTSTGKIS